MANEMVQLWKGGPLLQCDEGKKEAILAALLLAVPQFGGRCTRARAAQPATTRGTKEWRRPNKGGKTSNQWWFQRARKEGPYICLLSLDLWLLWSPNSWCESGPLRTSTLVR